MKVLAVRKDKRHTLKMCRALVVEIREVMLCIMVLQEEEESCHEVKKTKASKDENPQGETAVK